MSILSTTMPDLGVGYVVKWSYIGPSDGAGSTVINLKCGQDIALHLNPRYINGCVVLNSQLGGGWGAEERPAGFPLVKGVETALYITILPGEFEVKAEVSGQAPWVYKYKHRTAVEKLDGIEVGFAYGAENTAKFKDFYVLKAF